MSDKRPDYVKCIARTDKIKAGEAWCGRPAHDVFFTSIDHAAYNGLGEGRMLACPECLQEVSRALRHGHTETKTRIIPELPRCADCGGIFDALTNCRQIGMRIICMDCYRRLLDANL